MAAMALDPSLSLQISKDPQTISGMVIEEVEALIRVYKDGHVERPQIVPYVKCTFSSELGVLMSSRDILIDKLTNNWARFYVPKSHGYKLPLLIYFHGGGFCVGSPAWSCYHEFLSKLAEKANCVIMSVNYRLAPENRLPAAYEDGVKAVTWVKQQALSSALEEWWSRQSNFSKVFLGGDSAGANIAYNVNIRLASSCLRPLTIAGTILIQPFFGGETRTHSEKFMAQPPRSALSLAASDTYWRLSLPPGVNRDHIWSNPLTAKGSEKLIFEDLRPSPVMVCISELDILKDRNLEFVAALGGDCKRAVKHVVYKGVGHAFQILTKSKIAQERTLDMLSHINAFINES